MKKSNATTDYSDYKKYFKGGYLGRSVVNKSVVNKQEKEFPYKELTYKIIGAAMEVHKALGHGFLEAVYEEALTREFKRIGLIFKRQEKLDIMYKGEKIKEYETDFIVEDKVLVEIKAIKGLTKIDQAQLHNYLKATLKRIGLLFNFGTVSLEYKRVIK